MSGVRSALLLSLVSLLGIDLKKVEEDSEKRKSEAPPPRATLTDRGTIEDIDRITIAKPAHQHGCGSFACKKDPRGCQCHCRRCRRSKG